MLNCVNGFGFGDQKPKQLKKTNNIEIYYQNARGLRTKLNVLQNNIESLNADIYAITETGCNDSIMDAEIIPPNYQIIRCDRADGRKQGGAFLVATHRLELRRVQPLCDVNIDTCAFEIVGATVYLKSKFLFFLCVVYIPPKSNECEYMLLFRILEQWRIKYSYNMIVLGDFNLNSSNVNVTNYFEYFMTFCEFIQLNKVPNCNDRQLDLVLCSVNFSNDMNVYEADAALVPIDAYHPPLAVALQLGISASPKPAPSAYNVQVNDLRPKFDFYKANYKLLYADLGSIDWNCLYEIQNPEEALNYFYSVLYDVLENSVPKKCKKRTDLRYCYPEWYTRDLIKDIKLKAELHRKYKSTGLKENYELFSKCRARIKRNIDSAYHTYQDWVQNNLAKDPKTFWDYVRSKKGSRNRKSICKDGIVLSDSECATEFAKYFYSVYHTKPARLSVEEAVADSGASGARVHVERLTLDQVSAALVKLKPKRSAGPDGIPAFVMRDCRFGLSKPLAHIFNICLRDSYFPDRWKTTRVIPIPKAGGGSKIEAFRPVAILSTPAKVLESALQRNILEQISPQLSDAQHGFRPARSTTSNLLNAMAYVVPSVDAGLQVDAAYFDYKKAFDLVDNDILLSKLARLGCTPKMLHFFASYMRDRKQYVEYCGYQSEEYFTRSGVSQGSNLGPLEFIIMVNDLPDVVRDAKCLLFADDLKLLLTIEKESDCLRLQQDIDRVIEWNKNNSLTINSSKCAMLSFSRARLPLQYNYLVDGEPLQRVQSVRDLGVRVDAQLTFREHIHNVCKKAYKSLGFVLRTAQGFTNIKAIATLYDALIRSQLECNAAIWAPHENKYKLMLERIQNKYTRFLYLRLYGVYPFYPLMYPTLFVLGMVGYNKLETRRDLALAEYVLRVFRGDICNPGVLQCINLCVPDLCVHRRRRSRLFTVPRGRTKLLDTTPLTRTLHTLNLIAEKLDIFICSRSDFVKVTLNILCY